MTPVIASNSSSASSKLSWQPSQEANLKTATLGFFGPTLFAATALPFARLAPIFLLEFMFFQ
jgi:hypothetical protein